MSAAAHHGWSTNARRLGDADPLDICIESFDGRNEEAHGASLSHKAAPYLEETM